MNNFEYATKNKLRFPYKGSITVEDLWDLSIDNLNEVYKTLSKQKRASDEDSLLSSATTTTNTLDIKIDIVKYIFSVKQNEIVERSKEQERKQEEEKLKSILAQKKDEELLQLSPDEIWERLLELREKGKSMDN